MCPGRSIKNMNNNHNVKRRYRRIGISIEFTGVLPVTREREWGMVYYPRSINVLTGNDQWPAINEFKFFQSLSKNKKIWFLHLHIFT